ncbi:phosphate ABC transporter permease PstA [Halobacterium litoreum]|uniref:Phosphate transport system permease protein PstA n=1 Tax=Halobacterium litoreum TaxID=2039234 RepID=A0ABD5NHF5_9EURY|nr:phosphate ABC transporter permease PstA [Halobacterium litoreum]UHH12585.1 phosphate ABC transporter permease PstA [Halobacterium litoreum]
MATESGQSSWYGEGEGVSQFRSRVFRFVCLGASLFGLALVGVFLVKVFLDAIRPLSADAGWHLTFFLTLVAPTTGLLGYYWLNDRVAGWNGVVLGAIPLFGLILGAGLVLVFVQVYSLLTWFGVAIGLAATAAVFYAHRRFRREASGERNVVTALAFLAGVVGVPYTGRGFEVMSLAELANYYLPVLPSDIAIAVLTLVVPAAAYAGNFVRERHESSRAGLAAAGVVVAVAAGAVALAPTVGVPSWNLVVLALPVFVPTLLYAESFFRLDEHRSALAFPVVLYGGVLAGAFAVRALDYAGPNSWLDWQFLTGLPSRFPEQAGFYPAIVGSVMIMLVIIVGVAPLGVAAAIYLEEYATHEGALGAVVKLIEVNIGNLAGVPSVVYGLLALGVFVNTLGMQPGIVVLGGLAVGLLVLPIVIISSQEAIRAVPDSLRQASYGMGATKWQTVRNVVLPEALPGILTGSILAFGRAIGETAPLLMIGVAAAIFRAPGGFFETTSAMPRQVFAWSTKPAAEFRYGVLAAGVVTLLVVLLAMNAAAIVIRNKYQRN